MVSTSDESNIVYVKARSINEVSTVNAQTVNNVKNVVSYNDKSHIYEKQAEAHANTAKHYADVAMQYAEYSKEAEIWAEGSDEEVKALGGEHSAKTWAELLAEGTGGKWGNILGNITEQYDLMEQLDSKVNTSYVDELVEGFESSLGDKVSTEDFNVAVGSFNEAIENVEEKISEKQDKLTAGENITISDNVISAEDGINNKVTNCILAMPEITYSGNTFTIKAGTKALIPNGFNVDGTFNNVEWTAQNDIVQTVDLHNDSTHLVYRPDLNILVHSNFLGSFAEAPEIGGTWGTYYNTTENRFYMNGVTVWHVTVVVILAELTAIDGVITTFEPKKPVKLVTYDDIKDNVYITETYQNGTSWYNIYSNGWCEQGGIFDSGSDVRSIAGVASFLIPFRSTDYLFNFTPYRESAGNFVGAIGTNDKQITQIAMSYYGAGTTDLARFLMWEAKGYIR